MADEYGADDDLIAALAATERSHAARSRVTQPTPQRIQQPKPQRLDNAPPPTSGSKIVQPTPQALPQRSGGSNILVSPRQRGNPVLTSIKSTTWEYSDIPADFVLGTTTCALFLSLKYHRLHPEYVYKRIRDLQGKYLLRILLTMVDIPNHEDSLKELSKTSVVNNVTIITCWSAAEAARYLELYKAYEHANFEAIKGKQSSTYAEKLIDFVTVPRSLNKSDAVSLVANFGSLKNAINADAEQLSSLSGWGGAKVKRWTSAVEEPFRAVKAAKRSAKPRGDTSIPISTVPLREMYGPTPSSRSGASTPATGSHSQASNAAPKKTFQFAAEPSDSDSDDDNPGAQEPKMSSENQRKPPSEEVSDGVAAALARLRQP